jgi:hypothetical protein
MEHNKVTSIGLGDQPGTNVKNVGQRYSLTEDTAAEGTAAFIVLNFRNVSERT